MNSKGQVTVGVLIMSFVVIIAALALLSGGVFSSLGEITTTGSLSNRTYTAPSGAGVAISIPYQALKGTITITNATSGTVIPSTNYTVTNYVVENGVLVSKITATSGNSLGWYGKNINVTATLVEPYGYDTNSGNRAIIGLVVIFSVLAVAIVALSPVLQEKFFDLFS